LFGEVIDILDGGEHPFDGEEGGEVGRVGGDDDEGEEPPGTAHHTPRQRPTMTHAGPSHVYQLESRQTDRQTYGKTDRQEQTNRLTY